MLQKENAAKNEDMVEMICITQITNTRLVISYNTLNKLGFYLALIIEDIILI